MRTMITGFLALLLALGVAACATHPALSEADQQAVQYHSKSLEGQMEVVAIDRRYRGDLLTAQVKLLNRSAFNISYAYKFRWFDSDGFEIAQDRTPWTPVQTPGRGSHLVQGVAPSANAVSMEIWLKQ